MIVTLLLGIGCEKESIKNDFIANPGIIPKNHERIENIFELKYGDKYDYKYNGKVYSFSIINIVDSVNFDCASEWMQRIDPLYPLFAIRTHAFLLVNIDDKITRIIKVSSKQCGAMKYNNRDDITEITNMIEMWDSNLEKEYLFANEFERHFGEGTHIDGCSINIFMAKSFPIEYKQAEKKRYKFIFILTK